MSVCGGVCGPPRCSAIQVLVPGVVGDHSDLSISVTVPDHDSGQFRPDRRILNPIGIRVPRQVRRLRQRQGFVSKIDEGAERLASNHHASHVRADRESLLDVWPLRGRGRFDPIPAVELRHDSRIIRGRAATTSTRGPSAVGYSAATKDLLGCGDCVCGNHIPVAEDALLRAVEGIIEADESGQVVVGRVLP